MEQKGEDGNKTAGQAGQTVYTLILQTSDKELIKGYPSAWTQAGPIPAPDISDVLHRIANEKTESLRQLEMARGELENDKDFAYPTGMRKTAGALRQFYTAVLPDGLEQQLVEIGYMPPATPVDRVLGSTLKREAPEFIPKIHKFLHTYTRAWCSGLRPEFEKVYAPNPEQEDPALFKDIKRGAEAIHKSRQDTSDAYLLSLVPSGFDYDITRERYDDYNWAWSQMFLFANCVGRVTGVQIAFSAQDYKLLAARLRKGVPLVAHKYATA